MNILIDFTLFIISILISVLKAWILLSMWKWFIVPTFEAPELSLGVAYGVILITYLFRNFTKLRKIDTVTSQLDEALESGFVIATLLFTWLIAFGVYLIM